MSARRGVRSFLAQHLKQLEKPCLLVTHDVRDAMALDAQIVVLTEGEILQQGSVAMLRSAPASPLVAELMAID